MKLRNDQWIVLGMGIVGVLIALYLKATDSEFDKFFPIFYAGISMIWIAFINDRRSCKAKKEKNQLKNKL
ncbi:hypothetical protein [Flagellimonas sp.]|uniref:hypothetical protein n=1 Tax=Flagellimonas sp. TaxID=2058762 RepID=UPI003F4A850E